MKMTSMMIDEIIITACRPMARKIRPMSQAPVDLEINYPVVGSRLPYSIVRFFTKIG